MDSIRLRLNTVVLEPRGAAKTTWGNTILGSWLAGAYKDIRIGLFSKTATQAHDFSRAIRNTQESAKHIEVFGRHRGEKWTDQEWIRDDSRWNEEKDVTMFAQGMGGAVLSKRFDIILLDDILDEDNSSSPEAREKIKTWFLKTLLPCLVPDGVVICIGTRWGVGDLHEHMMAPLDDEDDPGLGWRSLLVKALSEGADGRLISYWPEHWTVEQLLAKRTQLGTPFFSCAYMNDISGLLAGSVFQARTIRWYKDAEGLPPGRKWLTKMGIDLASSEKQTADFTCRCVTSMDLETGDYYVRSAYKDRRETHHSQFVKDGHSAYPEMALALVEDQAFQSTLIHEIMQRFPEIPIEGRRADTDKVTRARAVAAKFEAGKVYLPESMRDSEYHRELLSFPKGHDDFVDALGLSMDLGGGGFFYGSLKVTR